MNAFEPMRVSGPSKWRPKLGLVVMAVFAMVLTLPFLSIFLFRIYENQLVQQTESELIAQSAALAAVWRQDILTSTWQKDGALANPVREDAETALAPVHPSLDLASDPLLQPRPDARQGDFKADPALQASAARLMQVARDVQRVTLTGFRLLDANGVVIGGREETGMSLAHVEEVATALQGQFRSVMRVRILRDAAPPVYSLSRGTRIRLFAAMPVVVAGKVAGVVYVSRTPSNVFRQLYAERGKVTFALLTTLGIALLIGFIFLRTISQPVHALIARTDAIAKGDRSAMRPLAHHGTEEFVRLSDSFLDMATNLHHKSDYISTFAAHVSHELKSPLTSISGAAELLRDDMMSAAPQMSREQSVHFLGNIGADALRLTQLVGRLRELAQAENLVQIGQAPLSAILEDAGIGFPHLQIVVQNAVQTMLPLSQESAGMVFGHLLDNAVRHGANKVEIDVAQDDLILKVVVRDNGAGISANNRMRIFDDFFTTRRETGGTGMGLSIVRALLAASGGSIELLDSATGAAFCLSFPLRTG